MLLVVVVILFIYLFSLLLRYVTQCTMLRPYFSFANSILCEGKLQSPGHLSYFRKEVQMLQAVNIGHE